jgi:hypothetical protein
VKRTRTRAPSLHRHCPVSTVLWAPPTPAGAGPLIVPVARGIPGTPAGLPCCASFCVYMPCPLPRRAVRSSSVGLSDRPCQPSPISGRLGARIVIFEAFSDFTRVTACTLASPPKEDNCPWSFDGSVTLPAVQVATGVNRLFPGPDFHRLGRRTFARRPRYSSSFSCLMMPHPGSSIIQKSPDPKMLGDASIIDSS